MPTAQVVMVEVGAYGVDVAKQYRLNAGQRLVNVLFTRLTERGKGAAYRHILSVPGRKTGTLHSTPVDVMTVDGTRWLVAPYGQVNWVRNVRAARGEVTLRRGSTVENLSATEISGTDAVPAIRSYLRLVPVTRRYWDVSTSSTDTELAADAVNHPTFRLGHRVA
jgi:deazaflavin-dependent oxidoreductase (nitroreductase family)